jgi:membrane protease YdiL (CAAX protease family)
MDHREKRPGGSPSRTEWLTTGALVALLLAYANGGAWWATRRSHELVVGVSRAHIGMLALMLLWGRAERLSAEALGLSRKGMARGIFLGAGVACAGAVPIRAFFGLPRIARWPVDIAEYRGLTRRRLIWLLCGQFFLGSALFEEVAFRGLLHAKLVRLFGVQPALLIGSAVFTAWHVVIAWHNVRRSNVSPRWFAPFYGGVLGILFVAGYLFGYVRERSGHVAGSVVTHWMLVGHLLLEIARLAGLSDPVQRAVEGELPIADPALASDA